jgi:hypothetical protein
MSRESDSYRTLVVLKQIGRVAYHVVSPMPLDPDVFQLGDCVRVNIRLLKSKRAKAKDAARAG